MHRVEAVRIAEEISRRFRRAADAGNLGDAMRLDGEFEAGLDDPRRDRVMPATGAQGRDCALVIAVGVAELVLRQLGVMELRLGEIGHEETFSGVTFSLSRCSPIDLAMKRAVIGVPS